MVAAALRQQGHRVELVLFTTRGDQDLDRALHEIGQKGLFTAELEEALLSGGCDMAVHSLKDLPTDPPAGLEIGAYALPEDARDVLISRGASLKNLPAGSRVGTSSLRRTAFIRRMRPDLLVVPIRGNLHTRVEKWHQGQVDAVALAAAGVKRMGWDKLISEYFDPLEMVPSPGQGILAVEVASHRHELAGVLADLMDPVAMVRAAAERGALAELGGGCQVPMGAFAFQNGVADRWRLVVQAASLDGQDCLRYVVDFRPPDAQQAGCAAGQYLRDHGALAMMNVHEG